MPHFNAELILAMLKRPASAADATEPDKKRGRPSVPAKAGAPAKPRKLNPLKEFAKDIKKKCTAISTALEDNEILPEKVASLLAGMVENSLGVCKDQREACQEACVKLIGEGLQRLENGLEQEAAIAKAKVQGVDNERDEKRKARAEAEDRLKALQASLETVKSELNSHMAREKEATKAMQALQQSENSIPYGSLDPSLVEAVDGLIEEFRGKAADADDQTKLIKLIKDMKKLRTDELKIDETVITMLPVCFKKAPENRTDIDRMLNKQLDSGFGKIKEHVDSQSKQTHDAAAKAKEALESAQKDFEDASSKKGLSLKAITEHEAAVKEASKAVKGLAENVVEPKKLQKLADAAEAQLTSFRAVALAHYKELLELSQPAATKGAQASPSPDAQPSPDAAASAAEGGATEAEGDAKEAEDAQEDAGEGGEEDAGAGGDEDAGAAGEEAEEGEDINWARRFQLPSDE